MEESRPSMQAFPPDLRTTVLWIPGLNAIGTVSVAADAHCHF